MMEYDIDFISSELESLSSKDKDYSRLVGVQSSVLLDVPDSHNVVAVSNILREDTHYLHDSKPADIGYKSLVSCYSKLMSFGARPAISQCTINLSNHVSQEWMQEFFQGFRDCRELYGGNILSCNFAQGKGSVTIDSMGIVPKSYKGALGNEVNIDDLIYVTGTLGDSGLALQRLMQDIPNDDVTSKYLLQCLLRPKIPLNFAIATRNIVTSSVTIVDGFSKDLSSVLSNKNLGASIILENVPLSEQIQAIIERNAAYQLAFTGGDDYQLCFTVAADKQEQLHALAKQYNCKISHVGAVTDGLGFEVKDSSGGCFNVKKSNIYHFRKTESS